MLHSAIAATATATRKPSHQGRCLACGSRHCMQYICLLQVDNMSSDEEAEVAAAQHSRSRARSSTAAEPSTAVPPAAAAAAADSGLAAGTADAELGRQPGRSLWRPPATAAVAALHTEDAAAAAALHAARRGSAGSSGGAGSSSDGGSVDVAELQAQVLCSPPHLDICILHLVASRLQLRPPFACCICVAWDQCSVGAL